MFIYNNVVDDLTSPITQFLKDNVATFEVEIIGMSQIFYNNRHYWFPYEPKQTYDMLFRKFYSSCLKNHIIYNSRHEEFIFYQNRSPIGDFRVPLNL